MKDKSYLAARDFFHSFQEISTKLSKEMKAQVELNHSLLRQPIFSPLADCLCHRAASTLGR